MFLHLFKSFNFRQYYFLSFLHQEVRHVSFRIIPRHDTAMWGKCASMHVFYPRGFLGEPLTPPPVTLVNSSLNVIASW